MTDDLGSDARALLESARRGHDPHPTDKARVKKAVLASIAAASAGVAATAEAAPAATSGGLLSSGLVKVGLAIGVAGVLGVSAVMLQPADTPTANLAPVVTIEAPKEAPVVVEVEEPVAELAPEPKKQPVRVPAKVRPAPAPEPAEIEPAEIDVSTLAAEAKLLAEVRIALDAGRYDDVLRQVDKHTSSYPTGLLREEALAARVLALCGLDRSADAEAAREALVAVNPRSAHLARIKTACR